MSELRERQGCTLVPDGWSYTNGNPGRIHVVYQWKEDNKTKRIRFAFHGDLNQFIETFSGNFEVWDNVVDNIEYRDEVINYGRTSSNVIT